MKTITYQEIKVKDAVTENGEIQYYAKSKWPRPIPITLYCINEVEKLDGLTKESEYIFESADPDRYTTFEFKEDDIIYYLKQEE